MATQIAKSINKYVGAMFSAVPGGYLGLLDSELAAVGGDMLRLMKNLSVSTAFASVLPVGATDREIAFDFVDRIVGDTVSAGSKTWAVEWMMGQRAAGTSWGEIVYRAIAELDGIPAGNPAWGAAAAQMRARADYATAATEGWAWNVTDLGTLRDVHSYAISDMRASLGSPVVPLDKLAAASGALATAAANLGAASGAQSISNLAPGAVHLLGAGDDTVTVTYNDLPNPAFVSGGDGFDTLVIRDGGTMAEYDVNTYQGVFQTFGYRGFEKVIVDGAVPYVVSFNGVTEYVIDQGPALYRFALGSIENGASIHVNLRGGAFSFLPFTADPNTPFSVVNNFTPAANSMQTLDELSVSVAGPGGGVEAHLWLAGALNVRHLTWTATDATASPAPTVDPWASTELETLDFASNVRQGIHLLAPKLASVDLSRATAATELILSTGAASRYDGMPDTITVKAGAAPIAVNWSPGNSAIGQEIDTTLKFDGELKAGSKVSISYVHSAGVAEMTRSVFGPDFSQLTAMNDLPQQNYKGLGSVFDVTGAKIAAAQFKGIAPAGQTIGSVSMGYGQTTIVKVDGAAGLDVDASSAAYDSTILQVINTGAGSALDTIKAGVLADINADRQGSWIVSNFQEMNVGGGRILWVDGNGNGRLDGLTNPAGYFDWATTPDIVLMETTSTNLGNFSAGIVGLGFNALQDPFA